MSNYKIYMGEKIALNITSEVYTMRFNEDNKNK